MTYTPYELRSMHELLSDARPRIVADTTAKTGHDAFLHLNNVIVESLTKGQWKYNIPALMRVMSVLDSVIRQVPEGDVPLTVDHVNEIQYGFMKLSIADVVLAIDTALVRISNLERMTRARS